MRSLTPRRVAPRPSLDDASRGALDDTVHEAVQRMERWMRDPTITELIVNGGNEVWIEHRRTGVPEYAGRLPNGAVEMVVERALAPVGRRIDRSSPVVDARLVDGSRLCAVLAPVAVDGTCLAVRRFASDDVGIDAFTTAEVAELLCEIVQRRCNTVVSGATSSGKTTLLGALGALCPVHERIITLEDTAELRIDAPHVLRLESRPATPDGIAAIDLGALVRAALRLRPDRLVVGEIRGDEASELLQALNTGHDGSLSSIHANSPHDAIARLESLVMRTGVGWPLATVRHLVQRAVDVVVHVERLPDGIRRITEVAEVLCPRTEIELRRLADGRHVHGELSRGRS